MLSPVLPVLCAACRGPRERPQAVYHVSQAASSCRTALLCVGQLTVVNRRCTKVTRKAGPSCEAGLLTGHKSSAGVA